MKYLTISVLSALISGQVAAAEYQHLNEGQLGFTSSTESDGMSVLLDSTYYLKKKTALGPLDEFNYINNVSNVAGHYEYYSGAEYHKNQLSGEYFLGKFTVNGSFGYTSDENSSGHSTVGAGIGYFVASNILIKANYYDHGDTDGYLFSAQYTKNMGKKNYLGFTITSDEDLEDVTLETSYFHAIAKGQYAKLSAKLSEDDWYLTGKYFLSERSSAFLTWGDNSVYEVGAKHFFDGHWALKATYRYEEAASHVSSDKLTVSLIGQF